MPENEARLALAQKEDKRQRLVIAGGVLLQALCDDGNWEEVERIGRQVIAVHPDPAAYRPVARALLYLGRSGEAIDMLRLALSKNPNLRAIHDDLIMMLDMETGISHAELMAERHRWWLQFGKPLYRRPRPAYTNTRDPERVIRIGYVSGDVRHHSVAIALQGILTYQPKHMEVYLYNTASAGREDDVMTEYRRVFGSRWRDAPESDDAFARMIREDKIDILVDLSGYTPMNRLTVFCLKPAPITIHAWGYATGCGWKAMDYFFACPVSIPQERRSHYVETIVDLPCLIPFNGDDALPLASPLPCLTAPPVFGVFQRPAKINEGTIAVWRDVLKAVPESRIAFKGPHYSETLKEWIRGHFGELASRVEFWPHQIRRDHLTSYDRIDLSLDPFPQTGGVSTAESLWMGVPVVTWIGDTLNQRTSAALMAPVGLSEFVVHSYDEYVREAVEWVTTRRHRLNEIRLGLRERMATSPLCSGYPEAVENVYRNLWRIWCLTPQGKPAHTKHA